MQFYVRIQARAFVITLNMSRPLWRHDLLPGRMVSDFNCEASREPPVILWKKELREGYECANLTGKENSVALPTLKTSHYP